MRLDPDVAEAARAAFNTCGTETFATPGALAKALDPRTVQTPALQLIDEALVDVADGADDRLMISLAPQEGKSQRTSRRFPLWMLQRKPGMRVAIVSYAHNVARRWGRAIRDDIRQHGDRLGLAVHPGSAAAHEWQLAGHDGGVYCVGIEGSLTSRPVDLLIIDDPYKDGKQADSPAWQETVQNFWTEVAIPRLGPGVAVVIIQTRWRFDDLSGWLAEREDGTRWRVLNIPAQADHRPELGETDPLGREPGEFMASARGRTVEQWERRKLEMGTRAWTALCQGKPSPGEGLVFNRGWWRYFEQPQWVEDDGVCHALSFDEIIQSWDMAFKDTDGADFVVGQVWGRRGSKAFLLDQVRGRMSFVDTCLKVRALSARWPQASAKLIEDKANGTAVINQLQATVGGLIPVQPDGSKIARASAVSPFVEAGDVWLPAAEVRAWVDGFVDECAAFPLSSHDDQVDAASQALNRLLLSAVRPRVRWL